MFDLNTHILALVFPNNMPVPSAHNAGVAVLVDIGLDILVLAFAYLLFIYIGVRRSCCDVRSTSKVIVPSFFPHAFLVICFGFFADGLALSTQPSVKYLWEYNHDAPPAHAIITFSLAALVILFVLNYFLSAMFLFFINRRTGAVGKGEGLRVWITSIWIALSIAVLTNPVWLTIYFAAYAKPSFHI